MLVRPGRALAVIAAVAGLGLAAGACGTSTTASAPKIAVAPRSEVAAVPHLIGQGTTLTIGAQEEKALASLHVSVIPSGTAATAKTASGATALTFPITSGYVEVHNDHAFQPGWIVGSIEHGGSGLTLSAAGTSLTASNFVVDPGNSVLYATVVGRPAVPFLTLDGTHVRVSTQNGSLVLDGTVARLTRTAAAALDDLFGTSALTPGLALGTVHLVASGSTTYSTDRTTELSRLTGTSTSVQLDPQTARALKGLGVRLVPSGAATFDAGASSFGFPITGGTVVIHSDHAYRPGYIDGVLIHQGSGLTFSKGATTVALTDFVVDPGNSMLTGSVGGHIGVPLLALDGTDVTVTPVGATVHLDGTIARLTPTASVALNQAFATNAFTPGLSLGVVHIVVAGH